MCTPSVRCTFAEAPQRSVVTERKINFFRLRSFPNMLLLFVANPRMVLGRKPLTCVSATDSQRSVWMKPPVSELTMYIFLIAGEGEQGFAEGSSAGPYPRAPLE